MKVWKLLQKKHSSLFNEIEVKVWLINFENIMGEFRLFNSWQNYFFDF